MRIEMDPTLKTRACATCARPFGKWTCCDTAYCNICIVAHKHEGGRA